MKRSATCLCLLLGLGVPLGCAARREATEPPPVAGQAVPRKPYAVDFSKRYDLICSGQLGEPLVYRNCRILGFTGTGEPGADSSSSSYGGQYFDTWLVIELPDKRLAYLPPNEIRAFEETKPAPPAKR